jgi:glycosyltransferase involved in cell wall biosynthesis
MTEAIDVLLATFDGARFLPELLRSIERQTYSGWRLIVRDDGSSDRSGSIIEGFADRHGDRVRVLRDAGGQLGACGNFGALLEASDAPYFMFCDQDDVWLPEKIADLLAGLRAAEARRGATTPLLVHSDLILVDEELRLLHKSYWRHSRLLDPLAQRSAMRLMLRNYVTGCAMIGNAALRHAALPIPREARMHDWWTALVASVLGEVIEHGAPTTLYRQHQRNELGAQSRHPIVLASRFIREPLAIARLVREHITAAQLQAAALERAYGQAMPSQALEAVTEFARLGQRSLWQRKRFISRYDLWPDSRLSSAICWWFL